MSTIKQLSPLDKIRQQIKLLQKTYHTVSNVNLLAVTKNRTEEQIRNLLENSQRLFGENRIQEAQKKWPALKSQYPDVSLHLIGHLQTNKVKEAVSLFDVIETIDSIHLAKKLQAEQQRQHKQLEYFIQLNIGKEPQKSGVSPDDFDEFYQHLVQELELNITGIMCIPPLDLDPAPYFQLMTTIAKRHNLPNVSMGMSDDYEIAIAHGATIVRLGRALW